MKERMISVILPVYNSKYFLFPLLDVLSKQTYKNYEVLIIDDGSTDGTKEEFLKNSNYGTSFKYITKKNGGPSSARNMGLDLAEGEFITFIDSDDTITEDYLETFAKFQSEYKTDLVSLHTKTIRNKNIKKTSHDLLIQNSNVLLDSFFAGELGFGPTSKLFKMSLLQKIRFNEKLTINEDKVFLFEYILKAETAFVSVQSKYFVIERDDSLSKRVDYEKKEKDLITAYSLIKKLRPYGIVLKKDKPFFLISLLYIYKIHLLSNKLQYKKDDVVIWLKDEVINVKKGRGRISFRVQIETFSFLYLRRLYSFVLSKYYAKK